MQSVLEKLWPPFAVAITLLTVGTAGVAMHAPWLFPSLGPTMFLQATRPDWPSARIWNVVAGHSVGIACATGAVYAVNALGTPHALGADDLVWPRVFASAIALPAAALIQELIGAPHPSAAASALLVTLGAFPVEASSYEALAAGIGIVAVLGEALRRLRLHMSIGTDPDHPF